MQTIFMVSVNRESVRWTSTLALAQREATEYIAMYYSSIEFDICDELTLLSTCGKISIDIFEEELITE